MFAVGERTEALAMLGVQPRLAAGAFDDGRGMPDVIAVRVRACHRDARPQGRSRPRAAAFSRPNDPGALNPVRDARFEPLSRAGQPASGAYEVCT